MITVKLEGFKEATDGLKNMAVGVSKNAEDTLDQAGEEVKNKMAKEAPVRTGALSKSIKVSKPKELVREIEPFATNVRPGNKYGAYVEEGTGAGVGRGQYVPNVSSIQAYFGVDEKMAWAIALSIMRRGTPSNPFISRTFEWTEDNLDKWGETILVKMEVDFDKG